MPPPDVTTLLGRWRGGDTKALRELFPIVYKELRRIAESAMQRERDDHTLEATGLVHEAFLRLAGGQPPNLEDRGHFFALAARLMRRILVDHARGLRTARRGGGQIHLPLEQVVGEQAEGGRTTQPSIDLLALDEALTALSAVDRRKARVVEMRFFAGLDVEETAELLGVSVPTVVTDTRFARAWLFAYLDRQGDTRERREAAS